MSNTANYVLLYARYCVGIDFLDRNKELLQKQTGIFGKAESFPYIDAWKITHVAWEMAGYFLMPNLTKNFKSSGTLPKIMWWEGYFTEGEQP